MQFDAKTTWWLTFAMMAVQGLNSVAWASLDVNPHIITGISQATGYLTLLLTFAIHGSIPGVNSVQMPKVVVAIIGAGVALLLLHDTAYAQFANVPPGVVEHYVGGVLLPVAVSVFIIGFCTGVLVTLIVNRIRGPVSPAQQYRPRL